MKNSLTTFNLICNDQVLIYNKSMSFIKAMMNTFKKQDKYKGCKFEIKYNSTI